MDLIMRYVMDSREVSCTVSSVVRVICRDTNAITLAGISGVYVHRVKT
jgi:hypothetical protein